MRKFALNALMGFIALMLAVTSTLSQNSVTLKREQATNGQMGYYLEVVSSIPLRAVEFEKLICNNPLDRTCTLGVNAPIIGGVFIDGAYQQPTGVAGGVPLFQPIAISSCVPAALGQLPSCTGRVFRIYLPSGTTLINELGKLSFVMFNYPDSAGINRPWQSKVSPLFERFVSSVTTNCPQDEDVIGILYRSEDPGTFKADAVRWFSNVLAKNPADLELKTNAKTSDKVKTNRVKRVLSVQPKDNFQEFDRVSVCLQMESSLPRETYNAILNYTGPNPPPAGLLEPVRVDKIEPFAPEVTEAALADTGKVEGRKLEKNLDLVVSFVTAREKNDAGVVESRSTGTADIRLVPKVLFDRYYVDSEKESAEYSEWKPIYLDAKVSTGKIEKATLSVNRIAIGSDFEYRYYAEPRRPSTYYRLNLRGINASDRDFKLVEAKFNAEFRPVWGMFNRPIKAATDPVPDPLDPGNGKPKIIPGKWGYRFVPLLGFELGGTYRNARPAANQEEKPPVLRGIFGFEFALNPTKSLTFTVEERAFLRSTWESENKRWENYVKASIDLSIYSFFNTPQSVVFSYENGKLPPFDKEVVNTFKVGYRIRTNW